MTERERDRLKGGIKGDTARSERLAAELRRNLRRRKDRARAMEAAKSVGPPAADTDDAERN